MNLLLVETFRFRDGAAISFMIALGICLVLMVVCRYKVPVRDSMNFPARAAFLILLALVSAAFVAVGLWSAHDAASKAERQHKHQLKVQAANRLAGRIAADLKAEGFLRGTDVFVNPDKPWRPSGHVYVGQAGCAVPVFYKHIRPAQPGGPQWYPGFVADNGKLAAYSIDAFSAIAAGCRNGPG